MKVLPSEFKGILFRSRTEARWAVLFDAMGIAWNYEPEGHVIGARGYLPDFYLPEFGLWFEVKPDETDGSERDVFAGLCGETGKKGIIAYGPPAPGRDNLWLFYPNGETDGPYHLAEDRRDDQVYWLWSAHPEQWGGMCIGGPGKRTEHERGPVVGRRPIEAAYAKAAAERFGT